MRSALLDLNVVHTAFCVAPSNDLVRSFLMRHQSRLNTSKAPSSPAHSREAPSKDPIGEGRHQRPESAHPDVHYQRLWRHRYRCNYSCVPSEAHTTCRSARRTELSRPDLTERLVRFQHETSIRVFQSQGGKRCFFSVFFSPAADPSLGRIEVSPTQQSALVTIGRDAPT